MMMTHDPTIGGRGWVAAAFVATTILVAGAAAPDEIYEAPRIRIQPDAEWQRMLGLVAGAKDADSFDEQLIPLRRRAEGDWPALFSQLLLFHDLHEGDQAMKDAIAGRILRGLNPSRHAAIVAIAPQLDNEEASIRATAARLLAHYEDRSPTRAADFSAYRDLIEQNVRAGRPTSEALMRHLFESDASLAVKTLVRAFQLRDLDEIRLILKHEHAVAELTWKRRYGIALETDDVKHAADAVEACAGHDRWWVRLYAVKTMTAHPELATPGTIGRVANDSDVLVAEAFTAFRLRAAAAAAAAGRSG